MLKYEKVKLFEFRRFLFCLSYLMAISMYIFVL